MELEVQQHNITGQSTVDTVAAGHEIESIKQESIVEGYKKEYSIVGDGIYASVSADDAPQWLLNIVDAVVNTRVISSLTDLQNARVNILAAIDAIDVAKNQYEELINIEATIDGIIASRLATLNATLNQNTTDILTLQTTKVTEDEAIAIAATKIAAELNDGAIKAQIDRIDTAIATETSARAGSIETLTSMLEDEDTGLVATAEAIESLQTYVGVDSAGAGYDQSLSAYLKSSNGMIGGTDSKVANLVYTDSQGNIKSKWEYNNNININGVNYPSGFGLKVDGANSEYWINADKFKFTNTANDAPSSDPVFSIDTTNGNKVQFNGIVRFGNSIIDSTGGVSIIDGDSITTGYINAERIRAGILKSNAATSNGLGIVEMNLDLGTIKIRDFAGNLRVQLGNLKV